MAANSGFPMSLDVKGYPVLVLGGDEEAAEKTQRLLEAGAKVTVYKVGDKYMAARSNEFGYANYEIEGGDQ